MLTCYINGAKNKGTLSQNFKESVRFAIIQNTRFKVSPNSRQLSKSSLKMFGIFFSNFVNLKFKQSINAHSNQKKLDNLNVGKNIFVNILLRCTDYVVHDMSLGFYDYTDLLT